MVRSGVLPVAAAATLSVLFAFLVGLQMVLLEIRDLRGSLVPHGATGGGDGGGGLLHPGGIVRRRERESRAAAGTSGAASATATAAAAALREDYLNLIVRGLMGGLTHGAELDVKAQSYLQGSRMNACLTRDWKTGQGRDFCIVKWDGYERLQRVRDLYERVRSDGVPGDLVECGVWRGGITIYMRALIKSYGDDEDRDVWVSDSFSGVPNADQQKAHPDFDDSNKAHASDVRQWGGKKTERAADGSGKMVEKNILTVEGELVRDNFRRFGLLDDRVKFLPGWFNEALPEAAERGLSRIAILRIDGDLYSSTMDVLVNLYKYVVPGGYVIFDDYNIDQSKQAIHEFFDREGLDKSEIKVDRITGERYTSGEPTEHTKEMANKSFGAYFRKPLHQ